jgi:hypothetical protein
MRTWRRGRSRQSHEGRESGDREGQREREAAWELVVTEGGKETEMRERGEWGGVQSSYTTPTWRQVMT